MAYVELRAADELRVRVGRMTPELGAFPLRHDPANHDTSDKPLPYDMGRMLRVFEWNEGVLPAPWVDTGIELIGTHFFDGGQLDYAAYLVSGPRGGDDAVDFDYTQSRGAQGYNVDNNSEPSVGGRLWGTLELGTAGAIVVGASTMAGHHDPAGRLGFAIAGVDLALRLHTFELRTEYLARWTELGLGTDPATRFKYLPNDREVTLRDGFYVEAEQRLGRLGLIARWDGLRHAGNVLATSALRERSSVLRYTAAAVLRLGSGLRLKTSVERYSFSDVGHELAVHAGIALPF